LNQEKEKTGMEKNSMLLVEALDPVGGRGNKIWPRH
jgi:hypothetical protein